MNRFVERARSVIGSGTRSTGAPGDGSIPADLQALQLQVQALERHVHELQASHDRLRDRQLDEFDRIRGAVSTATDDLSARIAHLQAGAQRGSETP